MPFSGGSSHVIHGYSPVITQPNSGLCSCVETVKSDSLVQGVTGSREGAAKVLVRGEQARITLAYSEHTQLLMSQFLILRRNLHGGPGNSIYTTCSLRIYLLCPTWHRATSCQFTKSQEGAMLLKLGAEHIPLLGQEVSTHIIYSINTRHLLYKNRSL